MGHRANYVLVEKGESTIFYTPWGATVVPEVLLAGFARTRRYAQQLTPHIELMSEVWAEGAALIDDDQHRLLFWGGENIQYEPYLRRALLPALRFLWPGWTVEWAAHGIADLADYLHIDKSTVLTSEDFQEGFRPDDVPSDDDLSSWERDGFATIITIKRSDGLVFDYAFSSIPGAILSVGPRLLDFLLAKGKPVVLPHERELLEAEEGAYLDIPAHAMSVWNQSTIDPRYIEALQALWTGWQVDGHVDGIVRQVALSGRDVTSLMIPLDEAVADLVKELTPVDALPNVFVAVMTSDVTDDADRIEIASGIVATRADLNSVPKVRQILGELFRSALGDAGATSVPRL